MSDDWVLLVPAGVEVTQTVSNAVDEPTLVTRGQIVALADAVAAMKAAGIPVSIGDLLKRRSVDPDQQVLKLVPEAGYHDPVRREAEYPCVCGKTYTSPDALKQHQQSCGTHHNGFLIPREHQVDS